MPGLRDAIDQAARDQRHDCGQLLQAAGDHIDELRHMIVRLMNDAHRMHMIGSGYRDAGQAILYAEAQQLLKR